MLLPRELDMMEAGSQMPLPTPKPKISEVEVNKLDKGKVDGTKAEEGKRLTTRSGRQAAPARWQYRSNVLMCSRAVRCEGMRAVVWRLALTTFKRSGPPPRAQSQLTKAAQAREQQKIVQHTTHRSGSHSFRFKPVAGDSDKGSAVQRNILFAPRGAHVPQLRLSPLELLDGSRPLHPTWGLLDPLGPRAAPCLRLDRARLRRVTRRQDGNLHQPAGKKSVAADEKRVGPLAHKSCEGDRSVLYHRVPRLSMRWRSLAVTAAMRGSSRPGTRRFVDPRRLGPCPAHPRASARPSGDHRRPPRPWLDHRDKPATG